MKKRIISMALALVMMLSLCVITVSAEETAAPYESVWLEENFDDPAIFSTAVTKWPKAGFNASTMKDYRGEKYAIGTANEYDYWANRGEAPMVVVTEGGLAGDVVGDQAIKMTVNASNTDAYMAIGNYAFTNKAYDSRYGVNVIEYDFMLSGDGEMSAYSIDLARAAVRIVNGKVTLESNAYKPDITIERNKAYNFKMVYKTESTSVFRLYEVTFTELATGKEITAFKEPFGLQLIKATYMHFPKSYPCAIGFKSATVSSGNVDFYLDNFKHYRIQNSEEDKTFTYTADMPDATDKYDYVRFGTFDELGFSTNDFANSGNFNVAWFSRREDSTSLVDSPAGTGKAIQVKCNGSESFIYYNATCLGDIQDGYDYTSTKERVIEFDFAYDLDLAVKDAEGTVVTPGITTVNNMTGVQLPSGVIYIGGYSRLYDLNNKKFRVQICNGPSNSGVDYSEWLDMGVNHHVKMVFSLSDTTDAEFESGKFCRNISLYIDGKRVGNELGTYMAEANHLNSFYDSKKETVVFGRNFTAVNTFLRFGFNGGNKSEAKYQKLTVDNIKYYGIDYEENAESTLLSSANTQIDNDTVLTEGKYGAEVILTRKGNETATSVFAALYKKDGNKTVLDSIQIKDVTFSGNLTAKGFLFTDFTVPEITGSEEYFIKTFVLDGSGTLKPVRNSVKLG